MFPFSVSSSEASAADLLEQVRWRDGSECPRCRSGSMIEYCSYGVFQRYRCKDCDRTFTLVDRGADDRYVVPAKSADESTVRLLLADHEEESLTVYTDGFRAYDPLEDDAEFDPH